MVGLKIRTILTFSVANNWQLVWFLFLQMFYIGVIKRFLTERRELILALH